MPKGARTAPARAGRLRAGFGTHTGEEGCPCYDCCMDEAAGDEDEARAIAGDALRRQAWTARVKRETRRAGGPRPFPYQRELGERAARKPDYASEAVKARFAVATSADPSVSVEALRYASDLTWRQFVRALDLDPFERFSSSARNFGLAERLCFFVDTERRPCAAYDCYDTNGSIYAATHLPTFLKKLAAPYTVERYSNPASVDVTVGSVHLHRPNVFVVRGPV